MKFFFEAVSALAIKISSWDQFREISSSRRVPTGRSNDRSAFSTGLGEQRESALMRNNGVLGRWASMDSKKFCI
jgi:hypothetical protein